MFVYVHPYPDGNGRMGRFPMNVMLAAGGYPWIVIPIERRDAYMAALEDASVRSASRPSLEHVCSLLSTLRSVSSPPTVKDMPIIAADLAPVGLLLVDVLEERTCAGPPQISAITQIASWCRMWKGVSIPRLFRSG